MSDTNDQPGGDAGLLDNVSVEDTQAAAAADTQKVEIDHKASEPGLDKPGAPKSKPEYLPDNFWDGEKGEANYEAMAKSWSDLRKMVSQGKHKAPEGGKYDTSSMQWAGDVEQDPLAKSYVGWAQKWGISQAAFDELAQEVNKLNESMAEPPIDTKAEMAQLGPNANAVINGMVDWGRGLVAKGVWSKDDFDEFKVMGGTARGLTALMKVRSAYEGRVPLEVAPVEGAPSKEELYAMVADPKYKSDAGFRQKVERLFAQHLG